MSWLSPAPGATSLESVFGRDPALLAKFRAFYGTLWDDGLLSPETLEMLRVRIAHLHGCAAELAVRHEGAGLSDAKRAALADWRASDLFSEAERAILAYADRMPFEHTFIDEAQTAAVRRHLDDRAFVAFTLAVAMFDALCRVRLVFALQPDAAMVPHPAAGAPLH